MTKNHISATDAARNFSDLLNRVLYRQEEFVIERGGQPICRVVPVQQQFKLSDLVRVLESAPRPDKSFWDDVEFAINAQGELPEPPK